MALYLDGQNIISGGVGSGGHTIVNNEGVSLEQRTNLQFKGAYSEDNSTDDTTEVNVVREMTKAEFDLLSDDEKVGIINITDITSSGDDRFQPVVYSFDEREIGVFVDGKPLYEKTYYNPNVQYSTASVEKSLFTVDDVDTPVSIMGILSNSAKTNYRELTAVSGSNSDKLTWIRFNKTNNNVTFFATDTWATAEIYVTIRYTKTTDTAGSGQWTPQGVPTHHYSEDEQVVGTWIDGSTLYEKTYSITAPSSNTTTNLVDISSLSIADVISVEGYLKSSGNITYKDDGFKAWIRLKTNQTADGKDRIAMQVTNSDYYSTSGNLTIKYTKSSS